MLEWRKHLGQFANPLIYLLLAAVVVSLVAWRASGVGARDHPACGKTLGSLKRSERCPRGLQARCSLCPAMNGGAMAEHQLPKRRRILFVARQACGNPALCVEVRAHAQGAADVLVVAPVLGTPLHQWISDETEDRALAEQRLEASVSCLRKHRLRAHGTLGDEDPVQAIADALSGFPAEEIIICLEEPERTHWLRKGVIERAKERFGLPVTEIAVASKQLTAAE